MRKTKNKLVVATGVFDIIHPGHIIFLQEARSLGKRLAVIVARDHTTRRRKREPQVPERQRLRVVASLKPVDEAILGDRRDILKPILELKPDVIALGPNQEIDIARLKAALKERGLVKTKVVRLSGFWSGGLNSSRKIIEKIRSCK